MRRGVQRLALLLGAIIQFWIPAHGEWIWIEGEQATASRMNAHPWYDSIRKDGLSGGALASNFHATRDGEADYRFEVAAAGDYDLWIRANPVASRLSLVLNGGPEIPVDFKSGVRDSVNIAADGKPDLRFLGWVHAGRHPLPAGPNRVTFRMTSANSHHGYLDCFVWVNEPFEPRGALKPDQIAAEMKRVSADNAGWFPFAPPTDAFDPHSVIDLRSLNEKVAGEHGFIATRDGHFIRSGDGEAVRFWAVNGPPDEARSGADLARLARRLAKYGVNLVRAHGAVFDRKGEVDPARVGRLRDIVAAMKAEGVYTHLSIYFPLWLDPPAGTPWLQGYDGKKHAFAALLFNPEFQDHYRHWWQALLLSPGPDGRRLVDDPAVFGLELQNEDSLFFWTFSQQNLPAEQWARIETQFGGWLAKKYGSIEAAIGKWGGGRLPADHPEAGRVGFRPLWNIAHERTARDRDTAAFLLEVQSGFYRETVAYLRQLGFKGVITASNWTTADNQVLGPLEKWSYTTGDFIDRHGYFGGTVKGDSSEWSIREGHMFSSRSALRFEGEKPGGARSFVHPAADVKYNGLPSMISETTWNRPNRFRGEAPLFFAAYGALQDSDAIVHFALDGAGWSVKPGFFMQPWTLMAPTQFGQFPAAALIYRRGLIRTGDVLADIRLSKTDLLGLKGTPLPQDAAFDELRLKDVPDGTSPARPGLQVDPLIHFAGRTRVELGADTSRATVKPLAALIDRAGKRVRSSTDELRLDYDSGVLELRAPSAQGALGNLGARGTLDLPDLRLQSPLDLVQVVVVSLDGLPIATSGRMLLQVMTEEKPTGWSSTPAGDGLERITSTGHDPWLVRQVRGTVEFKRSDAGTLKVSPLDLNGVPRPGNGDARRIELVPDGVYYLIHK